VALALTFPMVITVNYLGTPDHGVIACGYIGSLMVAFTFLAVSSLTSALNSNQVVSFIIALVVCLLMILAGFRPVTDFMSLWASTDVVEFTASLSVITHYDAIQRGVLDVRDFIYYATVIAFCLFSTSVVLHSRRAS
jgi:ABC-2 type transport system permease protein